jgi:isopenicillin N synthase-like dioxygenase
VSSLQVIDVSASLPRVAAELQAACRDTGFFYAVGHGIPAALLAALDAEARAFFAWPEEKKLQFAMAKAGRAWRGYFPVGGELTSGKPDLKEGLYFGEEHAADHPRVKAGLPLHGANQFPTPKLGHLVTEYMRACTAAAHAILEGLALSLGLEARYFHQHYTAKPTVLFRIFRYPPPETAEGWGVGEHTDYGLLTLLATDSVPGLQVKSKSGWIDAPPIEGALVCNLGDMLDRLTAGHYRSTPHRVRNVSGRERLSFPFFFDPDWDAQIEPLPNRTLDAVPRWDEKDLHAWTGTYGDYLQSKVSKVFPDLARR